MSPRLPAWLLRALLPDPLGDALCGDLDEEYETYIRPARGRFRAGVWYWRQALFSIPGALRAGRTWRSNRSGGAVAGASSGPDGTLASWLMDVRYGVRGLGRRPGFTVVALVTLALGIGANTAIFSVVNGVIVRPLPYHDPDGLVRVWPNWTFPFDLGTALEFGELSQSYEETSAFGRGLFTLAGDGEPEIVRGAMVLANHFSFLGAHPALGRGFLPGEGTEAGDRVVVFSHGLWQRRYGSDPEIVGRTVLISGEPHVVVGIASADHQPLESDWLLWVPIRVSAAARARGRGMALNGRLKPGVTPAQAQAESRRLYRERQVANGGNPTEEELADLTVVPLRSWMIGDVGFQLLVLLGAVAFVLLIASANVANLLLASGGARARELAVRRALGAGRGRLLRQLLTEAGVLGLVGGGLGVVLAYAVLQVGRVRLPTDLPRVQEVGMDAQVLGFAVVLSLASALVFGVVPALRATAGAATPALREGTAGSASPRQLRVNHALVAAEISLAVVLVAGAGLMLRSFWELSHVDPGFNPNGVLTLRVSPPPTVDDAEAAVAFHQQVGEALRAVPGVRSVGAIQFLPMRPGGWWSRYQPEGGVPLGEEGASVAMRVVTPGYFSTMGISLLAGRAFTEVDRPGGLAAIVVNQALAQRVWPDQDPVGRTLLVDADEPVPYRVVGVVNDVRQAELQTASHPEAYLPLAQRPWTSMFYAVKVDGDPAEAAPAVRAAVWSIHDQAPISSVAPLRAVVGESVAGARFFAGLLASFGALALLLGAVGVYGVMSYVVSLQRREIGIRMALGAGSDQVMRATILRGMGPVAVGLILGMLATLVTGRVLGSVLYAVRPTDPGTLLTVPMVLMGTALVALYVPARRASRVDPMRTLRNE